MDAGVHTINPPVSVRTARGDKVQHQRDVLGAASAILEEHGWDGYSIREIAARTDVSPGAIYQWFSGKSEIWAHLQHARFTADTRRVERWEIDDPLQLIRAIIELLAANHAELGRHRFDFVESLGAELPDFAVDLAEAQRELHAAIAKTLAGIGHRDDPDDPDAWLSWLWAVGKGLGDHMIDHRDDVTAVSMEDLMATAARCVLAGFTAD